jgi:hypothetical protein
MLAPPPLAQAERGGAVGGNAGGLNIQERRVGPIGRPTAESARGGGFNQTEFLAVVRRHQDIIKSCYQRALNRDQRLSAGRLDVTVTVGFTGSVKDVDVKAPAEFSGVSSCIQGVVKRMRFPASGEEYSSSFPVLLHGAG